MSIDYTKAICFGTVISEETANKIIDKISREFEDEKIEEFLDIYCRQVDSWCGGDYFLGFIKYLGDDLVVPCKSMNYDALDFDYLLDEWKINDIVEIDSIPQLYVVSFCH